MQSRPLGICLIIDCIGNDTGRWRSYRPTDSLRHGHDQARWICQHGEYQLHSPQSTLCYDARFLLHVVGESVVPSCFGALESSIGSSM